MKYRTMKEKVACLTYIDGELTSHKVQNRKVYSRPDGTMYVVVMGNKKDVHIDKDGGLYYKVHARTLWRA